jgi:hypothetical protein
MEYMRVTRSAEVLGVRDFDPPVSFPSWEVEGIERRGHRAVLEVALNGVGQMYREATRLLIRRV